MRLQKLHSLTDTSACIFEELTDGYSEIDIGRDFWRYIKSRILDDSTKKAKVSEYVRARILKMNDRKFAKKYGVKLSNIKKSREQIDFCCSCVSLLMQHSSFGQKIIDWS